MAPVRAALLEVKGVSRARVTLDDHEAVVTFDPEQTSIDDLIKAVGSAEGPQGPSQYRAKIKPEKGSL